MNAYLTYSWTATYDTGITMGYDPLRSHIAQLEFRSTPTDLVGAAGFSTPPSTGFNKTWRGYAPSPEPDSDRLKKLRDITNIMRFLQGSVAPGETPRDEHFVEHFNMRGSILSNRVEFDEHNASPYALVPNKIVRNVGFESDYFIVEPYGGYGGDYRIQPPTYSAHTRLPELKSMWKSGAFDNVDGTGDYNSYVKAFSWSITGDSVYRVYWKVQNTSGGSPGDGITDYLAFKEVAYLVDIQWVNHPRVDISVGLPFEDYWPLHAAHIFFGATVTSHYTRAYGEQPQWHTSPRSVGLGSSTTAFTEIWGAYWPAWSWLVTLDRPSNFQAFVGWDGSKYRRSHDRSFAAFVEETNRIKGDILPAGFLAQQDAYDKLYTTLSSNILETALELHDLLSPIDLAVNLRKIITWEGRPTPTQTMWRILDFLADWQLVYSFGYRPTEELAREFTNNIRYLRSKLLAATQWQTGHGSYLYTLENDEFPLFPGTVLRGGSKMRLRVPPDALLPALLSADSLSVLPTMSRVWDTLPWSFIVDYFVNISGKLQVIDLITKLALLQVGFVVNSAKVISPFTNSDAFEFQFEDKGYTNSEGDHFPSCYQYYERWVLPTFQPFTPTRLGLLAGKGVPDYRTTGALVYKIFS